MITNNSRARRYTPATTARGRAVEVARGFSLIELLIVVAIIGIIAAIAIPNLLASRRAANEASAISAVRTLSSAEEAYRATVGGGSRFTNFNGLVGTQMVDSALGAATTVATAKSGFVFSVVTSNADTSFCAGAAPATVNTGEHNFSSDEPGVLYVHPLAVASPPTSTTGGVPLNR
ncbi:MAG: type pilus assembly protein PilA [Acidobacteriota bacterium]|jgi:prepilin-type N-terminal cleavage/methylation domain-containing protein|nr:type pilus assembly protein PilA [Acidobacteriota bacterium]